jgi:hypothetical protein
MLFLEFKKLFLNIPAVRVGNLIIVEPTLFSREPHYSLLHVCLKIGHPLEAKSVQAISPTALLRGFFIEAAK